MLMWALVFFAADIGMALCLARPATEGCSTLGALRVTIQQDFSTVIVNTTFTNYLSSFMESYGCPNTQVQVLSRENLFASFSNATTGPHVSFVNPGLVRSMTARGIQHEVLVTMLRSTARGEVTNQLAGALVRKSSLHTAITSWNHFSSLSKYADNLTLCAVHSSFAGWHVQALEARLQADVVLEDTFNMRWHDNDDQVLDDVMDGLCDFGTTASSSLERVASSGSSSTGRIIPNTTFFVVGQRTSSSYPYLHSTSIYPDWAVVSMPSLHESVAALVKVALVTMEEPAHTGVALEGRHVGFAVPLEYIDMRPVELDLDLFNDGYCPKGWQRHPSGSKICELCPPGSFKASLTGSCNLCLPSFFNDESGATACTPCPEGYSSSFMGATFCRVKPTAVYAPIEACHNYRNNTLVIGMLDDQEHGVDDLLWRWRPTFEELFGHYLNQYECHVKLEIISQDQSRWEAAVRDKAIDFAFTDSGLLSLLNFQSDLESMATLQRVSMGHASQYTGGVMLRKSSLNTDLTTIDSIVTAASSRNISVCAVKDSFAGWLVQRYEFFKKEVDVFDVFSSVEFRGTHREVVASVLSGSCDVGFVRTAVLEKLEDQGVYAHGIFAIIGQQFYSNFVANVSTALYSEWSFSRLPHVQKEILDQIRIGLEVAVADGNANLLGQHLGFLSAPADHTAEQMLLYQLNLMDPPTHICPPGYERHAEKYLQPCVQCKPGWFKGLDQMECTTCVPGYYNNIAGASTCWHCPEGKGSLTFQAIEECALFPDRTLTVGILEEGSGKQDTLVQWRPTFEGMLNEFFKRYQCFFQAKVLNEAELAQAIEAKTIDFAFTDSGTAAKYSETDGLVAYSTVIRVYDRYIRKSFGGVIFRNAAKNVKLYSLQDVVKASKTRDLIVCAVSNMSLGGFLSQKYEFFKVGINVNDIASKIIWTGSHRESVTRTMLGECDLGMAETETLERLVEEQVLDVFSFVVLSMQYTQGFLLRSSTSLYPEWTLSALSHVPQFLAEQVSMPLIASRENDVAAIAGRHAGFITVHDLDKVDELRFQLGLAQNQTCGIGRFRNFTSTLDASVAPCMLCPVGYASKTGVGACQVCPIGSISSEPGSSECAHCPFGTSTLSPGAAECVEYSKYLSFSQGAVYAVWFLSSATVLGCLVVFSLIVKYRSTKLIKASSYQFNLLLVMACAIVCGSTVLFSIEPGPSNWVCSLRWWLPCLASSTIFGTLFSKTYRLHLIFRVYERKQKIPAAIKFKDMKVAALVSGFVGVTSVILGIFFLVDPPFFVLTKVQLEGQDFNTYVPACNVSSVFVPLIFTLYVLLLSCQSYLAFRVRKLPTLFNESQLIAWLLYNTCFVGLVGVVVDAMLDSSQITPKMVVRAVALLIGATTPVCVLFFPKIAIIWSDHMNDKKYSARTTGTHHTHNKDSVTGNPKHNLQDPDIFATSVYLKCSAIGNGGYSRQNQSALSKSVEEDSEIRPAGPAGNYHSKNSSYYVDIVPSSSVAGEETFEICCTDYPAHEQVYHNIAPGLSLPSPFNRLPVLADDATLSLEESNNKTETIIHTVVEQEEWELRGKSWSVLPSLTKSSFSSQVQRSFSVQLPTHGAGVRTNAPYKTKSYTPHNADGSPKQLIGLAQGKAVRGRSISLDELRRQSIPEIGDLRRQSIHQGNGLTRTLSMMIARVEEQEETNPGGESRDSSTTPVNVTPVLNMRFAEDERDQSAGELFASHRSVPSPDYTDDERFVYSDQATAAVSASLMRLAAVAPTPSPSSEIEFVDSQEVTPKLLSKRLLQSASIILPSQNSIIVHTAPLSRSAVLSKDGRSVRAQSLEKQSGVLSDLPPPLETTDSKKVSSSSLPCVLNLMQSEKFSGRGGRAASVTSRSHGGRRGSDGIGIGYSLSRGSTSLLPRKGSLSSVVQGSVSVAPGLERVSPSSTHRKVKRVTSLKKVPLPGNANDSSSDTTSCQVRTSPFNEIRGFRGSIVQEKQVKAKGKISPPSGHNFRVVNRCLNVNSTEPADIDDDADNSVDIATRGVPQTARSSLIYRQGTEKEELTGKDREHEDQQIL
eukprot:gb/GEZN01000118.1/.p1 GENE.gb/GEZN01000118.1/~~gb/GEZN01000118.1/.p1  ORF type:complete len:2056 (-),score=200.73 gb/GEZN01000118.1/:714-6881(-)